MNKTEIEKCVSMYPRLLSLGVDGKLHEVLRELAKALITYKSKHSSSSVGEGSIGVGEWKEYEIREAGDLQGFLSAPEGELQYLMRYRHHWMRSLLRHVVLKYPPILGTSMTKIKDRIEAMELIYMNAPESICLSVPPPHPSTPATPAPSSPPSATSATRLDSPVPSPPPRRWSDEFVTVLRRTPAQHDRWVLKQQLIRRSKRIASQARKN